MGEFIELWLESSMKLREDISLFVCWRKRALYKFTIKMKDVQMINDAKRVDIALCAGLPYSHEQRELALCAGRTVCYLQCEKPAMYTHTAIALV